MRLILLVLSIALFGCSTPKVLEKESDPYSWLENIEGDKALQWVEDKNTKTLAEFAQSKEYPGLEKKALDLLQAQDKIPFVQMHGNHLYNFWQDGKHVRGLLRRTTYESYKKSQPQWETVLDVDQLAKSENENWVFKTMSCLPPTHHHCLVTLSRGGKDASVVREFDAQKKTFVKGGFQLKEAKSGVAWITKDQVLVSTDFGSDSLTSSGYPRIIKVWNRGTDLSTAKTVFEGAVKDMGVWGSTIFTSEGNLSLISRHMSFYSSKAMVYENGQVVNIDKPDSAEVDGLFKSHLMLRLRDDWNIDGKTFTAGSIVAINEKVVKTGKTSGADIVEVFKPTAKASVLFTTAAKDYYLINVLENVQGKVYSLQFNNGTFSQPIPLNIPANGNVTIAASEAFSNRVFFTYEGFLMPESLYSYNLPTNEKTKVKSLPEKFKAKGMVVKQEWATSADGTKVPYFVVGKEDVIKKGNAPTLLYGYGGFEVSYTPSYDPITGKMWLEKGGVYVLANIRGGGEFGPKWHQAALKTNRQKAFDDFIAVAETLIKTNVTTRDHLAIIGGSNGGLLVGTVMTQRPDLFKGVVCLVPLLDMARYNQLLAGASWMAEYGDPGDTDEREYLLSYSPYHNVSAEKQYPSLFLMTSTKDDRVHPGHARKMAAKMADLGHKNLFYYENTEGGHAASANLKQRAKMTALRYAFLFNTIW